MVSAHPVARFDPMAVGIEDILHQFIHPLPGGGGEIFFDIKPAQGIAHFAVERAQARFQRGCICFTPRNSSL